MHFILPGWLQEGCAKRHCMHCSSLLDIDDLDRLQMLLFVSASPIGKVRASSQLNWRFLLSGIGTFQSRTPDIPYTLIPGDVASSIIVASMAATAAGQGNQEGPNITQACTSCSNPITLHQLTDEICHYYRYRLCSLLSHCLLFMLLTPCVACSCMLLMMLLEMWALA